MKIKNKIPQVSFAYLAAAFALVQCSQAASLTWDNTVGTTSDMPGDWTSDASWLDTGVPGAGDTSAFVAPGTFAVWSDINSDVSIGSITAENRIGVTIGGTGAITLDNLESASVISHAFRNSLLISNDLILANDLNISRTGGEQDVRQINLSGAISGTGNIAVTVTGRGLVALNSVNSTGSLSFDVSPANLAGVSTVNGVIGSNVTSLTKTGTGVLSLGAVNIYTGATAIGGGTLKLEASGEINANSAITVDAGATFDTTAHAYTFSAVTTTTIGVNDTAAGLINAAAATFSGATLTFDFGDTSTLLESYTVLATTSSTDDFFGVSATGDSIGGTFVNAGSGDWTLTAGGYDLIFSESLGTLTSSIAAIPEPSSCALIGGVIVLLGAGCMRRRRSMSL